MQLTHDGWCFEHDSSCSSLFPRAPVFFGPSSFTDHILLECTVEYKDVPDIFSFISLPQTLLSAHMNSSPYEEDLTCGNSPGEALNPKSLRGWVNHRKQRRQTDQQLPNMLCVPDTNEKFG